jgi:cytochrome c
MSITVTQHPRKPADRRGLPGYPRLHLICAGSKPARGIEPMLPVEHGIWSIAMKLVQAALMMVLALGSMAQAQESGEPRRGLAVARANCASCHAVARGERSSPNPSAPPFARVANMPGMTALALNHFMHSSHETMPLIILSPEDQWHLVAHILSLRRR